MRQEKGYQRIISYLLSIFLLLGLCGCGKEGLRPDTGSSSEIQMANAAAGEITCQLLDEAQLDYQVPEQYPGIWVSLGGYDSKGSKEAYFQGRTLPDTFRVINRETGECVYTGRMEEKRYNKETEEYYSYGRFTEFTDVGEYYIECDVIGRSYDFSLQEGLLQEQLSLVLQKIKEQGQEETADTGEVRQLLQQVIVVLMTYEIYPAVYEDGDGNQIPDILEYMTETVDKVIRLQQSAEPDELTYELIAALAKYSYAYQKYDNTYATEIIQLAAGWWQQAEKAGAEGETILQEDARLLAAAELYRATGQRKYVAVVEDGNKGLTGKVEQGNFSLYDYLAAITYISTKQRVNVELCSRLIRVVMNRAEVIAEGIPRISYREVNTDEETIDSMMWDMTLLSVVEYVITNYEYGNLIESQYYFLMGRNARSYDYWEQDICRQPAWTACYLMMLCEMRTNE